MGTFFGNVIRMKKASVLDVKDLHFVILYGTQWGQAKSIAEGILDSAHQEHKLTAKVFELNDFKNIPDFAQLKCPVVIVASTTGDGEPPETADVFWRKVRRKTVKPNTLEKIRYTILGLGDTNYNTFCNCGKQLNLKFKELGATLFYPPGWADDATGLDQVVDTWLENLWPALKKAVYGDDYVPEAVTENMDKLTLPTCAPTSLKLEFSDKSALKVNYLNPPLDYPLTSDDGVHVTELVNVQRLTKDDSEKTTLEFTLRFKSSKFDFEPGDAIGIVCQNFSIEVSNLLKRLKCDDIADKPFFIHVKEGAKGKIPPHIPKTCTTLRQLFLNSCDIRVPPKKPFLRLLAESCSDEKEKEELLELCSRQGGTIYEQNIRMAGLSILDILNAYPSCSPSIEPFIEHLPRLIPRAYSIASSPLADNQAFTFAFNLLTFAEEEGRTYIRNGVCSGWLSRLAAHSMNSLEKVDVTSITNALSSLQLLKVDEELETIYVYKRKNHNFRLPKETVSPVIMVGPGTGVVPFIGFIEHRYLQKCVNSTMMLFFGCRHKSKDFLFEGKLKKFKEEGTLSELFTSFSRDDDQPNIKYVQDQMEQQKHQLIEMLFDKSGYFYVCGDAKNMSKNVRDRLVSCIVDVKGVEEIEAIKLVDELVTNKRYLQDVWS